jgi:hypothetical protein
MFKAGGGGEIRTHGRVAPSLVFKTSALNRSATPPKFAWVIRVTIITVSLPGFQDSLETFTPVR